MAAICITTAAMLARQSWETENAYQNLPVQRILDSEKGEDKKETDWKELRSQNAEVVAWLTVEGTAISYPVVQPSNNTPDDFYLRHDFWKQPQADGCPYLDRRAQAEGQHVLVFGHQLGFSDRMFSMLKDAWKPLSFSSIGTASWITPQEDVLFEPLCACICDQDFDLIQRFSFNDQTDMETWLDRLVQQASAQAEAARTLAEQANRVLTLVTCSNSIPGTRQRTLVVFVASRQQP